MQGYAIKRVPKMVRGIVISIIISISGIGSVTYLQVQKIFFDEYPNSVYAVIAAGDILNLIFILICICLGKYGNDKEATQAPADAS